MTRDPGLEAQMVEDFGHPEGLTGKAMFGGWCFMLNGHMLGAARDGRAMYRVGKAAEASAVTMNGIAPMSQGGRPKPGFLWLSGPPLADDATRATLARMALDHVLSLPPKDR